MHFMEKHRLNHHGGKRPIIVDHQEKIREVARKITDDNIKDLNNDFILTREG